MTVETAQIALFKATQTLKSADVPDAARDARRLMAFALDVDPGRLTLVLQDPISPQQAVCFEQAVVARASRRPVSHIIGRRAFYGRDFHVSDAVLDPRPETEILIEVAIEKGGTRILDLGTGSGAILLSLLAELPESRGQGVDISPSALEIAMGNAKLHKLETRAEFTQSNWLGAAQGVYDLIVSNPPYITGAEMRDLSPEVLNFEPHIALTPDMTPDNDGLDSYRIIARDAPGFMADGAWLIVEIGPLQAPDVCGFFREAGLVDVSIRHDLDGRDRVVVGRKPA
ncbi:peptide chain release factor N(5)-glutamine methyltransferase [Halocynthiibacter namhaensis]|uniref:peptide chain release factor N(5)-glutamine methyltransferase n=1 Tax=Halocynthiibacter namhaensis TaxID=1290553 RepID=UPI0005799577|nr:peptide chain release factor N(5)-glutamine methyltransferase [Halocynthiibacter namhaensis]